MSITNHEYYLESFLILKFRISILDLASQFLNRLFLNYPVILNAVKDLELC